MVTAEKTEQGQEGGDNEPEMTKEEKMEKAQAMLTEGKRDLAAKDFPGAHDKLDRCCQLIVETYDQFAPEAFEPHLHYGKVLLELGRMQPEVFTNAIQGAEAALADADDSSVDNDDEEEGKDGETSGEQKKTSEEKTTEEGKDEQQFQSTKELTEDDREELREIVEEALEENAEALDKAKETGEMPKIDEPEDPKPSDGEQQAEEGTNEQEEMTDEAEGEEKMEGGESEDKEGGEAGGDGEESMDADQVPYLQLAWEVLEVARAICDKHEGDEWPSRKIDVLLVLGDVSIEDENYKQAVDDLTICLELQKKIYEHADSDRRVAETLFQMGRAYALGFDFEKAAEQYQVAKETIDKVIERLTGQVTSTEDEERKKQLQLEITDLQGLLPDIQAKVDDAKESAKSAAEQRSAGGDGAGDQQASAFDESKTAGAKDISGLVRKPVKRVAAEDDGAPTADGDETSAKRTKDANGEAAAVPVAANGDAANGKA